MWVNSELRQDARFHLTNSWGMAIGITFVAGFIAAILSRVVNMFTGMGNSFLALAQVLRSTLENGGREPDPQDIFRFTTEFLQMVTMGVAITTIANTVIRLLFTSPFEVSVLNWFNRNRETPEAPGFEMTFRHFFNNYSKLLAGRFWDWLWLTIWQLPQILLGIAYTVLAVSFFSQMEFEHSGNIPRNLNEEQAIIFMIVAFAVSIFTLVWSFVIVNRQIAYAMHPFILGDNPAIGAKRALQLSKAMMKGRKWHYVGLYLSFFGWMLLSVITCGIGFIVLNPYINQTKAELYAALRSDAVSRGLTSMEELGFTLVQEPPLNQPSPFQSEVVDPYSSNWGGPYRPQ